MHVVTMVAQALGNRRGSFTALLSETWKQERKQLMFLIQSEKTIMRLFKGLKKRMQFERL